MTTKEMIETLNINHPDYRGRVEAEKYHIVKAAMAEIMPREGGWTQAEMVGAVKAHFSAMPDEGNLFPKGDKAGWWTKCVQLDLEARGQMRRLGKSPLRFIWVD